MGSATQANSGLQGQSGTALPEASFQSAASDLRKFDASQTRLVAFAAPVMENLHQQLGSPTLTVILADHAGTIVCVVGPRTTALPRGSLMYEAPLPALAAHLPQMRDAPDSGRALGLVAGDRVLMGLSSPIMAADGGLLGILDASSSPFDNLSHASALLRTTAAIIEHRLIESDPQAFLLLRFHPHASVLGSPLEALALFDRDSRLLAANQLATELLAIGDACGSLCYPDCFGSGWLDLVGSAVVRPDAAFTLHRCDGAPFFARASLRNDAGN